ARVRRGARTVIVDAYDRIETFEADRRLDTPAVAPVLDRVLQQIRQKLQASVRVELDDGVRIAGAPHAHVPRLRQRANDLASGIDLRIENARAPEQRARRKVEQ